MSDPLPTQPVRVSGLPGDRPTPFALIPDADQRKSVAEALAIDAVRKLRFEGTLEAGEDGAWVLRADLGATVVQPCVVTLEPVTTRIDVPIFRQFVPDMPEPAPGQDEMEMDPDDTLEPLGSTIDPAKVMIEALALALPLYPRKEDAEPGDLVHAPPGVEPMSDDDAKPLAGLAALRDRMAGDDDTD